MLSATVMRRLEALETISKGNKRINGLFRLLEDRVLWHEAYANIYANKGAITPGVDEVTLDGFSEERVAAIIARLKKKREPIGSSRPAGSTSPKRTARNAHSASLRETTNWSRKS